jgi:hypothetical protein
MRFSNQNFVRIVVKHTVGIELLGSQHRTGEKQIKLSRKQANIQISPGSSPWFIQISCPPFTYTVSFDILRTSIHDALGKGRTSTGTSCDCNITRSSAPKQLTVPPLPLIKALNNVYGTGMSNISSSVLFSLTVSVNSGFTVPWDRRTTKHRNVRDCNRSC